MQCLINAVNQGNGYRKFLLRFDLCRLIDFRHISPTRRAQHADVLSVQIAGLFQGFDRFFLDFMQQSPRQYLSGRPMPFHDGVYCQHESFFYCIQLVTFKSFHS